MTFALQALTDFPSPSGLLTRTTSKPGVLLPPHAAREFEEGAECVCCKGVNSTEWLTALVTSPNIQEVTGLDSSSLQARLSKKWTAESALKNCKALEHRVTSLGTNRTFEQL